MSTGTDYECIDHKFVCVVLFSKTDRREVLRRLHQRFPSWRPYIAPVANNPALEKVILPDPQLRQAVENALDDPILE